MSLSLMAYLSGSAALVPRDVEREEEEMGEPVEATREGHRIEGGAAQASRFALAGNARFTLVSKKTGARFTYRVRAKKDDAGKIRCWFVSVLTGPNNGSDYQFLGTIFASERVIVGGSSFGHVYGSVPARAPKFVHGRKARIGEGAPSARAFAWWWERTARLQETSTIEVWHLGSCGRCGRDLTVPESIACGLGPECASRMEDGR